MIFLHCAPASYKAPGLLPGAFPFARNPGRHLPTPSHIQSSRPHCEQIAPAAGGPGCAAPGSSTGPAAGLWYPGGQGLTGGMHIAARRPAIVRTLGPKWCRSGVFPGRRQLTNEQKRRTLIRVCYRVIFSFRQDFRDYIFKQVLDSHCAPHRGTPEPIRNFPECLVRDIPGKKQAGVIVLIVQPADFNIYPRRFKF